MQAYEEIKKKLKCLNPAFKGCVIGHTILQSVEVAITSM
jgi:hypothetical protein